MRPELGGKRYRYARLRPLGRRPAICAPSRFRATCRPTAGSTRAGRCSFRTAPLSDDMVILGQPTRRPVRGRRSPASLRRRATGRRGAGRRPKPDLPRVLQPDALEPPTRASANRAGGRNGRDRAPSRHRLSATEGPPADRAVASTYWPILWPAPEPVTLNPPPWHLVSPPPAPHRDLQSGPSPAPCRSLRSPTSPAPAPGCARARWKRTHIRDLASGVPTERIFIDGGVFGPIGRMSARQLGTELGDVSERIYEIHPDDPLSARATMEQIRSSNAGTGRSASRPGPR